MKFLPKRIDQNNKVIFDKGLIEFNNNIFNTDFAFLIDDSKTPIKIQGSVPINKKDKLDLRLIGNGKFIDLIDIFSDEYFNFKDGDVNLRMIMKGTRNKPILNGFVVIKDSEIDIYKNKLKDINSLMIFDFDYLDIKNLEAKTENSGNIFLRGSLPFYSKNDYEKSGINLITSKLPIKTENLNFLIDSDIDLSGSFEQPVLGGNLSLNNGFINFNGANQNNKVDKKNNLKENKNIGQNYIGIRIIILK